MIRALRRGAARLCVVKRIDAPASVQSVGNMPKRIEEFVGCVTGADGISIARMVSPSGWVEPGQTPEFDEYTVGATGEPVRYDKKRRH